MDVLSLDEEFEGFCFLDKIEDVEDIITSYEDLLKDESLDDKDRERYLYEIDFMQGYLHQLKEDAEQEAEQESK